MAGETPEIPIAELDAATLYEMMRLLSEQTARVERRTALIEREQRELLAELHKLREAFTSGGLRGFRAALRGAGNGAVHQDAGR